MKKVLSLVLALVMVLGMIPTFAADATGAQALYDNGFITGKDGTDLEAKLDVNAQLTRAQMAALIAELNGAKEEAAAFEQPADFTDFATIAGWAKNYVSYAAVNGWMTGYPDGSFKANASVSAQQLVAVLMNALGYEVVWNTVLADAAELGIVAEGATLTRGEAFEAMWVAVSEVKMADSEMTLGENLGKLDPPVVTPEVPANLALTSAGTNNLKEVEVVFNKAVDEVTAENVDAYSLKQSLATKAIASATLLEDGKTVRLLLANGVTFTNQTEVTLTVTGVKAAAATQVLAATELKFTPVEVTAPVVSSVVSLGNKALKVTFSEPVTMNSTVAGTFKIDNVVVSGVATISGRTITLQLFSTLASGDHTLSINNQIVDAAGIQLVTGDKTFAVVADAAAPTIAEMKNVTLEGLTVVFSEDVQDTEALTASNYYWMQSTTKKVASSVEKIDGRTFKVTFSANNLPGYVTDVYVRNVKDYSANVIAADSKLAVTATLDQVRPEVLTTVFDATNKNKMTLTFTKNIDAASFKSSNVSIKKADGTTVANGYTAVVTGKTVVITFANAVTTANTYTFAVSGLTDTTLLKNAMLPYSLEFVVKNTTAPVAGTSVTGTLPNYIITFSKAMDTTTEYSVLNPSNYYVTYNTATVTGITGNLPTGTNIVPTADSKGVIITFPAGVTGVTKLVVQGVKDTHGNFLSGYAKEYLVGDFVTTLIASAAKATDTKTIYVKMNQPVGVVTTAGFTVSANTVTAASVDATDNTLVKLTLGTAIASNTAGVTVTANTSAATAGITGATLVASGAIAVADAIATTVVLDADDAIEMGLAGSDSIVGDSATALTSITVNFDEAITAENQALVKDNFLLFRNDGVQLVYGIDYEIGSPVTNLTNVVIDLMTTGDKLVGYVGNIDVVFDNTNENIYDNTTSSFVTTTEIDTLANGFDTRTDDKTGSIAINYSVAAPVAGDVVIAQPAAGVAVGKTNVTIANTLQFRVTDSLGVQKQAWTTGTGAVITTTTSVVAGDLIEVRVIATGLYPASAVYTHTVVAGNIGQ